MDHAIDLSRLPVCQKQAWEDMPPIPGGRLCEACSRCIVDMRGKASIEIARAFVEANGQLCGAYTPDQLVDPRMKPRPNRGQFANWLGAIGISVLGWTAGVELKAQMPVKVHQDANVPAPGSQQTIDRQVLPKLVRDTIYIHGKVLDAETDEGLPFTNALVKGTLVGTATDFDGNYRLAVPVDSLENRTSITLQFQYVGYEVLEMHFPLEDTTVGDVELEAIGILTSDQAIAYGVVIEAPTPMKRVKWFFQRLNPFRKRS